VYLYLYLLNKKREILNGQDSISKAIYIEIGISWSNALEIGGSWNKDLCVYVQTSIYIGFYNRIINN